MADTIDLYSVSVLIFAIAYSALVVFLIIQILKKEKIARPFLISLMLHFLLDLIGILLLYYYNLTTQFNTRTDLPQEQMVQLAFILSMTFLLFQTSPLYLIFNLEKLIFKKEIIKERHLFTIIQVILLALLVIAAMFIKSIAYTFLIYGLITLIQVSFFLVGFLYLGLKSSGNYKRNSFVVFIGYLWQFIVNIVYALVIFSMTYSDEGFLTIVGMLVILRLAGLLTMAYGLLKLYTFK